MHHGHDRSPLVFMPCAMLTSHQDDSTAAQIVLAIGERRAFILKEAADALAASSTVVSVATPIAPGNLALQESVEEFGDEGSLVAALVDELAAGMAEPLDACATEASFKQTLCAFGARVTDESSMAQLNLLYRVAAGGVAGTP